VFISVGGGGMGENEILVDINKLAIFRGIIFVYFYIL
jgi:hypothetical protein